MSQLVTWVRDRDPSMPGRYAVVVHVIALRILSAREWDGEQWRHMAASEQIECWAEGLRVPDVP